MASKPTKKVAAKKTVTKKAVKPATKKVTPVVTKNKTKNAGIIGMALIVLALIISVGTYAYYRTTVTGSIEGTILAWNCTAGGSSNNFNLTLGDLYPGKTGSWPIALSVTNFEADFTVSLQSPTNVDNLVFKHGETTLCKSSGNPSGCTESYVVTVDGTSTGSGTGTTSITYEWPLGEAQTTNIPVTDTASSIVVHIVCSQTNKTPYSGS